MYLETSDLGSMPIYVYIDNRTQGFLHISRESFEYLSSKVNGDNN